MWVLIIFFILYLISVIYNYKWMKLAINHKNGKWRNLNRVSWVKWLDKHDAYFPFVNFFTSIEFLIQGKPYE